MSSLSREVKSKNPNRIHIDGNLFVIICISLIAVIGITSINPVMPTIAKAFNVPSGQIGLIMAVFLIPTTVGALIFGALADRIGMKKILIPSLLVFGLGGILCAFASSFQSLLEWRFLTGLGAASLECLELTLIGNLYSGKMLTAAMGINAAMIGIAATIYPLIGGFLGEFNWRYPFLLSILAFPVALLISTKLKLPKKPKNTENLNLKIYLQNTWNNINNLQVFVLLFTVFSLFLIEFATCYTYIPIFAGTYLKASEAEIGIIVSSVSLAFSFAASQLGFFTRWASEKRLIVFGLILCALSLLVIPTIHNSWLLIIPSIVFGISQALAFPTLQSMLAEIAPEGSRAGFMALNVTIQSLGRALGPLFAGVAFSAWGVEGVFYASAVLAIITTVLFTWLTYKRLKPLHRYQG
ncbi:MAG: MFS transporter [Cyanomargarita calcarea GSE-NOS-MK-12-04C]|jgi:MFS family permease|uniref:MFS transporter n=1 Tax=Cyanomargarita calcarea GSE-NOS-MK-12-04C TaxID=2839659 RepID=A0A951QQ88_9CYAN|nr:MFS transporter [Cyanomargarita calcarea GSE-NOS-MK-12-04C]